MATDTRDEPWIGAEESISRVRGTVFELTCLGATLFGITMVFVLLAYVTLDATRPLTAANGWALAGGGALFAAGAGLVLYLTRHDPGATDVIGDGLRRPLLVVLVLAGVAAAVPVLPVPLGQRAAVALVYVTVLLLPLLALLQYYARRDPEAGWVGATTLGMPIMGTLVGAGCVVLFMEVVTPIDWLAASGALAVAAVGFVAHRRARRAASVERTVGALVVGVGGAAAAFGAVPGVPSASAAIPYVFSRWLVLLATVTVPVGAAVAWHLRERHDPRRANAAGVVTVLAALAGGYVGTTFGAGLDAGLVLTTAALVPTAVYVEGVLHRGDHEAGLLLPAAVVLGVVGAAVATNLLGASGPAAWLDWQFLTRAPSRFPEQAGIYPALVGSVMLMVVIALTSFPVGVGAALYLEEYAPDGGLLGKVVTLIEINIGNLAGVPSVVYGLLALAMFVQYGGLPIGSVVVGGLAVGLLVLPIVIISAQEAIRAVPDSMRQASYGMGATRWQTTRDVVLPEAMPGILTGSILAFGRAIGETAPLLMVGVASTVYSPPGGFFAKTSAMPRQIYTWAAEPNAEFRYGVLAAGVVTLLVVLLTMNAAAIIIRNRYQTQR